MESDDVARSIRFSKRLWDTIDNDAKRCKRSSSKQMEAILEAYYDLSNVDLNRDRLLAHLSDENIEEVRGQELSPHGSPIPHYEPGSKKRNAA
jgi:hypothetical protein